MGTYSTEPDLEGQLLAFPTDQGSAEASYDPKLYDYTQRLTRRQLFYILVLQGMGAAIIDATANFAIACAMYRTTQKEIRLWPLEKNTIAGDMGVTVIIQGMLTTLITSALVRGDVRQGRIEPFPQPWPDVVWWQRKTGSKSRWKERIGMALGFLSPTRTLSFCHGHREFARSLFSILFRGFIISTLCFPIFWPLAIAITAPLYGGVDMRNTWTPEVIKTVFGGVLGLFMNPFVTALVLGQAINRHSDIDTSWHPTLAARQIASTTPISRVASPIHLHNARIITAAPIVKPPTMLKPGPESEMRRSSSPVLISSARGKVRDLDAKGGLTRPTAAYVSTRS